MSHNTLGLKLKTLRKTRNIIQNDLSKQLGFSERYIAKIESGVSPSMEALRKIAAFFQVPLEYLISEDTAKAVPIENEKLLAAFLEVSKMSRTILSRQTT